MGDDDLFHKRGFALLPSLKDKKTIITIFLYHTIHIKMLYKKKNKVKENARINLLESPNFTEVQLKINWC